MRYSTPKAWASKYFTADSRPDMAKVRRWIQTKKIPGMKIGGGFFVDVDAWLVGGDELVDRVLRGE